MPFEKKQGQDQVKLALPLLFLSTKINVPRSFRRGTFIFLQQQAGTVSSLRAMLGLILQSFHWSS
ncbi:MAG: hypothetical protein ACLTV2_05730 [Acutalibacter sp.]